VIKQADKVYNLLFIVPFWSISPNLVVQVYPWYSRVLPNGHTEMTAVLYCDSQQFRKQGENI